MIFTSPADSSEFARVSRIADESSTRKTLYEGAACACAVDWRPEFIAYVRRQREPPRSRFPVTALSTDQRILDRIVSQVGIRL
jgi:hypothetical protein